MKPAIFFAAVSTIVASPALASGHGGGGEGHGVMVQAKDCVILLGGPGDGTCTQTHNQAGLLNPYVDQVTPWQGYQSDHEWVFAGNEWFSTPGTSTATISYYVHAEKTKGIRHFMHWNEDASGVGRFNLWYGTSPGDLADLVLSGIFPPNNPINELYNGQKFKFDFKRPNTGWWTLEMFDCPQGAGDYPACGLGEVAFGGPAVPEPGTWAMMIAGFGLVGWAARNRRRDLAQA
jgi:hypothetical protein